MKRMTLLLSTVLLTCGAPHAPAPPVLALADEADVDTDVDADADPMCSAYAPEVAWEPASPGAVGVRVRVRPDWDCSSYAPELEGLCDELKSAGLPVTGADRAWWLSGAAARWDDGVLAQLRTLPPEAFVASVP